MDLNMVMRRGAAGFLGFALLGAAIPLRDGDAPKPVRVFPAIVPSDPLAAEVLRCQKLGSEAVGNPSCEEAFAENGSNFFSMPDQSAGR